MNLGDFRAGDAEAAESWPQNRSTHFALFVQVESRRKWSVQAFTPEEGLFHTIVSLPKSVRALVTRGPGQWTSAEATTIGRSLFDAVFIGETLRLFRASCQRSLRDGLRISFHLFVNHELDGLPWELLYHEAQFGVPFLALSERILFARRCPSSSFCGDDDRQTGTITSLAEWWEREALAVECKASRALPLRHALYVALPNEAEAHATQQQRALEHLTHSNLLSFSWADSTDGLPPEAQFVRTDVLWVIGTFENGRLLHRSPTRSPDSVSLDDFILAAPHPPVTLVVQTPAPSHDTSASLKQSLLRAFRSLTARRQLDAKDRSHSALPIARLFAGGVQSIVAAPLYSDARLNFVLCQQLTRDLSEGCSIEEACGLARRSLADSRPSCDWARIVLLLPSHASSAQRNPDHIHHATFARPRRSPLHWLRSLFTLSGSGQELSPTIELPQQDRMLFDAVSEVTHYTTDHTTTHELPSVATQLQDTPILQEHPTATPNPETHDTPLPSWLEILNPDSSYLEIFRAIYMSSSDHDLTVARWIDTLAGEGLASRRNAVTFHPHNRWTLSQDTTSLELLFGHMQGRRKLAWLVTSPAFLLLPERLRVLRAQHLMDFGLMDFLSGATSDALASVDEHGVLQHIDIMEVGLTDYLSKATSDERASVDEHGVPQPLNHRKLFRTRSSLSRSHIDAEARYLRVYNTLAALEPFTPQKYVAPESLVEGHVASTAAWLRSAIFQHVLALIASVPSPNTPQAAVAAAPAIVAYEAATTHENSGLVLQGVIEFNSLVALGTWKRLLVHVANGSADVNPPTIASSPGSLTVHVVAHSFDVAGRATRRVAIPARGDWDAAEFRLRGARVGDAEIKALFFVGQRYLGMVSLDCEIAEAVET